MIYDRWWLPWWRSVGSVVSDYCKGFKEPCKHLPIFPCLCLVAKELTLQYVQCDQGCFSLRTDHTVFALYLALAPELLPLRGRMCHLCGGPEACWWHWQSDPPPRREISGRVRAGVHKDGLSRAASRRPAAREHKRATKWGWIFTRLEGSYPASVPKNRNSGPSMNIMNAIDIVDFEDVRMCLQFCIVIQTWCGTPPQVAAPSSNSIICPFRLTHDDEVDPRAIISW